MTVSEGAPLPEILRYVQQGRQLDLPIVDDAGRLVGVLAYPDLLRVSQEPHAHPLLLALDLATLDVKPVHLNDTLVTAMRRLTAHNLEQLPIVDREGRVLGVIARSRIWQAYDAELLRSV